MKLHRPRASQVSVAHHLHYKSCRVKMQEFSCGQLLQIMQQLGLLSSGNPAIYPKKLIPILNRLLRFLPLCIQIIQISVGRLHIVITRSYSISNNALSPEQIHFCRFRPSFHHINNTPTQLTDTIIQRGIRQVL